MVAMYYTLPVTLGPAESAMPWVYWYLPMMLNRYYEAIYNVILALNQNFSASCIVNGRKCTDWCIFWSISAGIASNMEVKNPGLIAMHEP